MNEDQLIALISPIEQQLSRGAIRTALFIQDTYTTEQIIAIYEYLTDDEADDHLHELIAEIVDILVKTHGAR